MKSSLVDEISFTAKDKKKVRNKIVNNGEQSQWFYAGLVSQIGFTISVPIVAGAFMGAYLDKLWSTYPKATLGLIFLGLFLSIISFIKLIREIIKS